jgi:alkaline phosphatase
MTRLAALLLVAMTAACAAPTAEPTAEAPAPAADGPFNVILMIGDGTGLAYWTAARFQSRDLSIQRFPVVGLVDTRSANSWITDSAAGATAYASGVRTYNGAVGLGPDSLAVQTVLEVAESKGWSTGLVATSTITHATPASFAAHVPNRNMHWAIAAQMAEAGVDVMLGGGRRFFDPAERPDSVDLLGVLAKDATVVQTPEEFQALDPERVSRLVGFFAAENPGSALERQPTLPELTRTALDILGKDDDGFFLMVEGSQIDWRGHENAPIQAVLAEVVDFDHAIRTALRFQEQRPNTLIVVTADHETGGLALHGDSTGVFGAHYTTDQHTATMVPMFARGPGADRFAGVRDIDEVGRLLLQLVDDDGARIAGAGADAEHGSQ